MRKSSNDRRELLSIDDRHDQSMCLPSEKFQYKLVASTTLAVEVFTYPRPRSLALSQGPCQGTGLN